MDEKRAISKRPDLGNIFIGIAIVLGIILLTNIFLASSISREIKKSAQALQEKSMPAKIELTLIKNSKCPDCFDISPAVDYVNSLNANITRQAELQFDSAQAKELIGRYGIEKIPVIVITGQIEKISAEGMEKKENALLIASNPPYTNALTGEIEGRVILYHLKDMSCKKCSNLTPLISQIKLAGVGIYDEKEIDSGSAEGRGLSSKYKIGFAPAIILSEDAAVYEIVQQAWPGIGTKESDGSYVMRVPNPPFVNLTTGKLRGLVNVVYLADKGCAECYDVSQHKEILSSSFGLKPEKEETLDISDARGKELLSKYNITKVPAVILSDEISVYPGAPALKEFFSVEKDGYYVFRNQVVGAYKDLSANKVVQLQQAGQ
ncbi:hypothetical protein HYX08_06430 [Candidatus Woesearchaeota archaeon]|nr:hypothetical protein [Candidatus Woesearchaeota archaeon]